MKVMHVYHLPVYASFQCEDRCRVTSTAPSAATRIPFGMTARLMICALSLTGLAACGGGGGGGLAASTTPLQLDNIVDASAGSGTDANAGGQPGQMGTPTGNVNPDPAFYLDAELMAGGTPAPLDITRFNHAYARGWTGKNSLVVVADTGIDTDHPDLQANIAGNRDYTGSSQEDENGHGTHVAGIVAAIRDGQGVHGAAFDAKMLIAKVARQRSYDFGLARAATSWGRDEGAVATNVSAAYLTNRYLDSLLISRGDGSYFLDHPVYGQEGFYSVTRTAADWHAALGPSQVLVKAAGNDGTAYSVGLNQLATATGTDGKLLLNGQFIVVGNWDAGAGQIRGNRAGHVCTTWTGDSCHDAVPLSSRFIMAPGTSITSTYLDGGYASISGTSMAAPMVSAAIAVLHQMWPHLNGRQLADILLATADRSVPGYAPHIHGMGLLDMEHATRPVGDVAAPQTDTVSGPRASLVGSAAIAGAGAAAKTALAGVMVLDAFDRDFHVDLGAGIVAHDPRPISSVENGGLVDGYSAHLDPAQRAAVHFTPHDGLVLTAGAGKEAAGFLGNRLSGILGTIDHSYTAYGLASLKHDVGPGRGRLFAQIGGGATYLPAGKAPGLLAGASTIFSGTATVGASAAVGGGRLALILATPVQITGGNLLYDIPVARALSGQVAVSRRHLPLRPAEYEHDIGLSFSRNWLDGALQTKGFVELRMNAPAANPHRKGPTTHAGLAMSLTF